MSTALLYFQGHPKGFITCQEVGKEGGRQEGNGEWGGGIGKEDSGFRAAIYEEGRHKGPSGLSSQDVVRNRKGDYAA